MLVEKKTECVSIVIWPCGTQAFFKRIIFFFQYLSKFSNTVHFVSVETAGFLCCLVGEIKTLSTNYHVWGLLYLYLFYSLWHRRDGQTLKKKKKIMAQTRV